MNAKLSRRSLLATALSAPVVAVAARFPRLGHGAGIAAAPETETLLLYPGGTVIHKYDIIKLEGQEAWIAGVSGDTITVIRGAFPAAPLSA